MNKPNIQTTKQVVPMLYGYSTPEVVRHNGWTKIGYTEQDLETRINHNNIWMRYTSSVAEQIRLQQWADQIRDCRNRPSDMKVAAWCRKHGQTKTNYCYHLRRVREACLELCEPSPSFDL